MVTSLRYYHRCDTIKYNHITVYDLTCFAGSLPRKDVLDIVEQYNNAFNLNLDISRASMLAISPDILDKSGNILLRPFLAHLSHR